MLAAPGNQAAAAVAQRRAFSSGFAAFGVKLGIPKLPPLPQTQGQAPSVAKPLPDGTFEPTLGFQDQVVEERVETQASPGGSPPSWRTPWTATQHRGGAASAARGGPPAPVIAAAPKD